MAVAVITGAGQGLGRADAIRLAQDGFEVMCLDRNLDAARETAELCGGTAFACDVTDRVEVMAVADAIPDCFALINNAGIWNFPSILEVTEEQLQSVIEVNIKGIVWCCQAFVPKMRAGGGGSIVNMSSGAAWTNSPNIGIYPATKAAVESLTRTLALELGRDNIRTNAIGPGLIVSDGTAANFQGDRAAERAKGVPMARVGAPADIADVVSFLCGEDSRYVNGQVIYVDGGITAGAMAR
jgi:NAD(P)-dependent dehydrogenase (short-subunit alcohol dehydrogenase family)